MKNIYALGQIESVRNNTLGNISKHIEYAKKASEYGAQIIIFPELSLTGYERYFEIDQLFTIEDKRIGELVRIADVYKIILNVGVPLSIGNKIYISSILIFPGNKIEMYVKKHLHTGEDAFFHSSKKFDPIIKLNGEQLSFAICYDIEIDEHIISAQKRNSSTYVASIFYSLEGINAGIQRLNKISTTYHMDVLMANYVGNCWTICAGGKCSVFNKVW
jgi:predicted amidohydrolase